MAALPRSCPGCGEPLGGTDRYCAQCGCPVPPQARRRPAALSVIIVASPLACLVGSLQPWAVPMGSVPRIPAWQGPWSLEMLGWPGTLVMGVLALSVLCSLVLATRPERMPRWIAVAWSRLGIALLGAGLGALTLAASPFAGRIASETELFGLGAWFGLAAGGRVFIAGALAWAVAGETLVTH